MTQYFAKIPFIAYDIDGSGEKRVVVNILQRIKMRDSLKRNYLVYYQYDVKDGERPEMIAEKLYGSAQYHWIVLLANDIYDPYYDWPMSYENMTATIRKRYRTPLVDGLVYAYETIHHYENRAGVIIDLATYKSLPAAERNAVSVYNFEMGENEKKRRIRLLDAKYVVQVDAEANTLMATPLT